MYPSACTGMSTMRGLTAVFPATAFGCSPRVVRRVEFCQRHPKNKTIFLNLREMQILIAITLS